MTGWDDIFVRRLTSPFRGMSGRGALVAWLCAAASLPSVLLQDKVAAAAWHLGLAVHWQWAYLVGGLIGCGFALLERRWHVLVAAAIVVVAWSQTSPSIDRGDATNGPALKVATANLNYETKDFRRLEDWLTSADAPDVVVLQEFTEGAQDAVQGPALTAANPHRLLAPREDPFGLAILSRLPLVGNERVEPAVHTATLALRSATYWQGRVVALSALHPMPPSVPNMRPPGTRPSSRRRVASGLWAFPRCSRAI